VRQTEYDWCYLYAAVNPVSGESSAMLAPNVNTSFMNIHLKWISEQAGPNKHVVLIVDDAGQQAWNALTEADLRSICHTQWLTHEIQR
jgi:hypothetical protein